MSEREKLRGRGRERETERENRGMYSGAKERGAVCVRERLR